MAEGGDAASRVGRRLGQAILIGGLIGGVVAFSAIAKLGHPVTGVFVGIGVVLGVAILLAIYATPPSPPPPVSQRSQLELDLGPILTELEAARLEAGRANRMSGLWAVPLGAAAGVGLWLAYAGFQGVLGDRFFSDNVFGGFMAALVCATAAYTFAIRPAAKAYEQLYKLRVLPKLTAGFGAITYRRAPAPDAEQLRRFHLFAAFDAARAEDAIVGQYRGCAISIVQLRLTRAAAPAGAIVFSGLLVEVMLANRLTGTTAIARQAQGWLANLRAGFGPHGLEKVGLEDRAFEQDYEVWSTDQVMARALVTPDFMERFRALNGRTAFGPPVALAQDSRLLIALPRPESFFRPPPYDQNAFDADALAGLRDDIGAVLGTIDPVLDLDAATRRAAQRAP